MKNKYVVVTTEHRGVFFGRLVEDNEKTVVLEEARNCLYWSEEVRGFLGLAANGPTERCKVGPKAPRLRLEGVTSISECSGEAVEAWEKEPWSS